MKGKILRIKEGYNPNSSSLGSIVFLLSAKTLLFTPLFVGSSALIYSAFMGKKKEKSDETAGNIETKQSDKTENHGEEN